MQINKGQTNQCTDISWLIYSSKSLNNLFINPISKCQQITEKYIHKIKALYHFCSLEIKIKLHIENVQLQLEITVFRLFLFIAGYLIFTGS